MRFLGQQFARQGLCSFPPIAAISVTKITVFLIKRRSFLAPKLPPTFRSTNDTSTLRDVHDMSDRQKQGTVILAVPPQRSASKRRQGATKIGGANKSMVHDLELNFQHCV